MEWKQSRTTVYKRNYIYGLIVLSLVLNTGILTCMADEAPHFVEGDSGSTETGTDGLSYRGNGSYDGEGGCSYTADVTSFSANDYDADMEGWEAAGNTTTNTSYKKKYSTNIVSEEHWTTGSTNGTTTIYTDGTRKVNTEFTDSGTKGTYIYDQDYGNTGCLAGKYCAGDWVYNRIEIPKTSVVETDGKKSTTTFTGDQITGRKEEYNKDGVDVIESWNYLDCTSFASVEDCAGGSTNNSLSYEDGSVDGKGLHITMKGKNGEDITFEFTEEGTKTYKQKITDKDGKEKEITTTVRATRDIENRPYFLGYDWHIENLDDRSSELFGGGKSLTTPMPKATKGGRDKGGLYKVGTGVFYYELTHFGNHTVTVTPWWDIDRYEVWTTQSCDDTGYCSTTHHERYLDSRLESREPKVYSVPVPLICDGCDGFKFCVGEGCADDCLNTVDLLCDEENGPEYEVEHHTALMR